MIEPRRLRGRDKPQGPVGLRRDAEKVAGALPELLAQAEHLAASVAMGFHGRRRAGHGENFWQYRQAVPGDPRSAVDWRRSGKSDQQFIREMEWEAAQTVSVWVDDALSMIATGALQASGARSALIITVPTPGAPYPAAMGGATPTLDAGSTELLDAAVRAVAETQEPGEVELDHDQHALLAPLGEHLSVPSILVLLYPGDAVPDSHETDLLGAYAEQAGLAAAAFQFVIQYVEPARTRQLRKIVLKFGLLRCVQRPPRVLFTELFPDRIDGILVLAVDLDKGRGNRRKVSPL